MTDDLYVYIMKGTKVQTLGARAVAGAWLVAWAIIIIIAMLLIRMPPALPRLTP